MQCNAINTEDSRIGSFLLTGRRYLLLVPLLGLVLAPAMGVGEALLGLPAVPLAAPGCSAVTGRRSQPPSCASNAAAGSKESSRNLGDREFISVPFMSNWYLRSAKPMR